MTQNFLIFFYILIFLEALRPHVFKTPVLSCCIFLVLKFESRRRIVTDQKRRLNQYMSTAKNCGGGVHFLKNFRGGGHKNFKKNFHRFAIITGVTKIQKSTSKFDQKFLKILKKVQNFVKNHLNFAVLPTNFAIFPKILARTALKIFRGGGSL